MGNETDVLKSLGSFAISYHSFTESVDITDDFSTMNDCSNNELASLFELGGG